MYRQKIETYFKEHREEFLEDLSRLIALNSEKGEKEEGFPYGRGPAAALDQALQIARRFGLHAENWENYLGIVELMPEGERTLDIMAHLDVVPGGEGWTVTEPFVMKLAGDKLYGRGTADDKGPALAALYALRAVKELGLPVKKNVRVMLGCDEECGSSELEYYFSRTKPAEMTFTPDAEFPLINLEKGHFGGVFTAEFFGEVVLPALRSVKGGVKSNVVPSKAEAEVEGLREEEVRAAAAETEAETGVEFACTVRGDRIHVLAKGVSAHASAPESGKNAITALLALLNRLSLKDEAAEKLRALHRLFPFDDVNGRAAGIYHCDEESGEITVSLDILHFDGTHLEAEFDSRTPLCADEESLKPMGKAAEEAGLSFRSSFSLPHYVPADSDFVRTLLECYEKYSGEKGQCLSTGGGTYVHGIENAVAFGCSMPGQDNQMHGPDEWASVDTLLMSGMIFTEAVVQLCR